ncbi:MAG: hypothetical protein WCP29_15265 [Acidobacteriota bacterium]
MKRLAVRVVMVAVAVAAQAAAGYLVWELDAQMRAERTAIAAFEVQVRQAIQALAAIESTQRGYVAEGQNSDRWQTQVTAMVKSAAPQLDQLRLAARTPEAQGALESAIETMASFGKADTKARGYVSSGQRLSASDVIFADGHDLVAKAEAAIEDARLRESAQHDAVTKKIRQTQYLWLGGAAGFVFIILLTLVPIPRAAKTSGSDEELDPSSAGAGLGLSRPSNNVALPGAAQTPVPAATTAPPATGQELGAAAEICGLLARVKSPAELPTLLERAAGVLEATGVIVWMTEGTAASLRPVLAHGYSAATLGRMGAIEPDADNATATAYRLQALQMMPADPPSGGALVVPMVTAEGCTGAMAVELKRGVEPTAYLCAVASILAAQLATLITPTPATGGSSARK